MISIEMITKNDNNINKSINAILNQEFKDLEIIIVDSSIEDHYKDYESISCIKYIHDVNSNFLNARFNANKVAGGDYVLLLDSTRILDKDVLVNLINLGENKDMVIIPEINKSKSKILNYNKWGKIDINYVLSNCNPVNGIFLPRFYKKNILDDAFNRVLNNINKNEINNICSLEDRMLYLEALKISNKIGVCKSYLIHIESESLMNYIKKYYRYGKCNYYVFSRISRYSYLGDPRVKIENKGTSIHKNSLKNKILFFIKTISFILGFLSAKFKHQ